MKLLNIIFIFLLNFTVINLSKADSLYLSTDSFGNTYGSVGGDSIYMSTDSFGNTYGSVGNNNIFMSTDSFGNTYGSFGN